MADIKDVSQAIHSALEEIGMSGDLDVEMDGERAIASIGQPTSDKLEVVVTVTDPTETRRAA